MSQHGYPVSSQMAFKKAYHAHPQGCGCGCQPRHQACTVPQPAPKRVYCHPAPFSSLCGGKYHPLIHAYGSSTFAKSYY